MEKLIALDRAVFEWLNQMVGWSSLTDRLFSILALWTIYLLPLTLLVVWFSGSVKEKISAVRAAMAGLFAWLAVNSVIGLFLFRPRPFITETTQELLFHRPDKSFPSDHAAFGLTLALMFYLAGYKKIGHWCLGLSLIFSLTRVIVGLHFPLDILGGWAVAILVSLTLNQWRQPIDRWLVKPLVNQTRKLKLG